MKKIFVNHLNTSLKKAKSLIKDSLTPEDKAKVEETIKAISDKIAEIEALPEEVPAATVIAMILETLNKQGEEVTAKTEEIQNAIRKIEKKMNKDVEKSAKKHTFANAIVGKNGRFNFQNEILSSTETKAVDIVLPTINYNGMLERFTKGMKSTNTVKVVAVTETGSCAVVTLHGIKPQIIISESSADANDQTFAGIMSGIAEQDLNDELYLETVVTKRAVSKLSDAVGGAAFTLISGSAVNYGNTAFTNMVESPNIFNAISAIASQVRQSLKGEQSGICVAISRASYDLVKNQNTTTGFPISDNGILATVNLVPDDNIMNDDMIFAFAEEYARMLKYVPATTEWGYVVKSVDNVIVSEWQTNEKSLRIEERDIMYLEDTNFAVKGSIAGIITDITKP